MSGIVAGRLGFGTTYGFDHFEPELLVKDVKEAEALGFDQFGLSDHLCTTHPTLETWTALAWAAAATERIEVMPNVLGLPYRPPAVTAKMAETLDRLSNGRLVLGLGTGGHDAEFAGFGLATRTPGAKVSALDEALQIIQRLWAEPAVTFEGEHFAVREASIEPRPSRTIPIWLGAYGPRSLRLTGARAQGWIPSLPRLDLDQAVAMRAAVRAAAEAAGRDPDSIVCAANLVVGFGENRSATARAGYLAGSDQAIAEQLVQIVRAGFTFLVPMLSSSDSRERFATAVMPLVRTALA